MSDHPEEFTSVQDLLDSWKGHVVKDDLNPLILISLNDEGQAIIMSSMASDSDELISILEQILNISKMQREFKTKGNGYES